MLTFILYCRDTTFSGGVVGKAIKGTICTFQYSGGVNLVCLGDSDKDLNILTLNDKCRVLIISNNI